MATDLPTTAHNEAISGDVLTNVSLNYEWRRFVVAAVTSELQRQFAINDDGTIPDDLDNWLSDLILDFYTEEVVVDGIQLGMIIPFAGALASIPAKYLLCNGALRASSEYPELAAMLASEFIEGANFRVPNLNNRFIRGATSDGDIGVSGGALSVTLTEANLPAHHHVVPAHSHSFLKATSVASQNLRVAIGSNATAADGFTSTHPATDTSDIGSGTSFQILPLHQNLFYIIKALP